ncbi:MAG: rod shape-determining protein MreC [Clostridia bacterium]|nr:rod shape-determining protein MreC [Clostridia bacterium]MCL6520810.1 rod shape-determining protein MreC [Bacillota bacterium]
MSRWRRPLRRAAVLLVVAGCLAAAAFTVRPGSLPVWPQATLDELLYPFEYGVSWVADQVVGAWNFAHSLAGAYAENRQLRQQLKQQLFLGRQLEEVRQENERLRQLLAMRETLSLQYPLQTVGALVIGRNPDAWFDTVQISAGSSQGVGVGDAVVDSGGLVGRVIRVSRNSATVLLVTDSSSAVGAVVERADSRAQGVVQAAGDGRLVMRFFSAGADVRKGDVILTSPLSGRYPPGIPVGTVTAVHTASDGLARLADLSSAADLNRLEEVLVIRAPR